MEQRDRARANSLQFLEKEARLLSSISHPNIIKCLKFVRHSSSSYMVMEYAGGGDLGSLIKSKAEKSAHFSDLEAAVIMKSLLSAVQTIHDLEIVHRDLKPDNILFPQNQDLSRAKIADFGLAAKFSQLEFKML